MKPSLTPKNPGYRLPAALAAMACALAGLTQAKEMSPADIQAKAKQMDQLVLTKLEKEKIQPTAPVSDEVFVRRIYLDISGRIPTLKETTDFLADQAPDKRAKLIDELLASDGYVQNFTNYWSDLLRVKSQLTMGNSQPAGAAYSNWVRDSLKANKPYNKMVQEMLTAKGKTYENGAVGFYIRDYNMPLDNMAVTTQVFLGTSMVCAQCHNHPFDKWTQMDYYQMAAHSNGMTGSNGLSNPLLAQAFYGRSAKGKKAAKGDKSMDSMMMGGEAMAGLARKDVGRAMNEILRPLRYNTVLDETDKKPLRLPHDYQYADAKPKSVVEPVIPAAFSKDGKIVKDGQKPIEAYASWVASKENPRFTLVIANRLWKKVMGVGVIEPVDEITDSSVPSNPQLMAFLEDTMKQVNYDMKAYLRIIYNSSTYQRAAYTKDVELGEVYHFPGPILRRMSAEQIWDSMVALYKPSPDTPSMTASIERESTIRRVEWLDRALNALSAQELAEGAAKVVAVQKQLAADVRKAQEQLTAANKKKDEDAIRAAKKVVANQRRAIDEAAEEIIYSMGFKKFAQLAREGKLKEQVDDVEFAKEITSVIRSKEGQDLGIDEALAIMAKQQRARLTAQQQQRLKRDAEALKVDDKKELTSLKAWENYRDTYMVRAADLRSPAPNGHFLREFGQSDRELVENSNDEASVGQALMLLNGKTFTQLLNPYTMISRALRRAETTEQTVDAVYLALFSRKATPEEQELLKPVVEGKGMVGKGDALWAALNTRQFYFIQ
ncbi:DUF1549 domain-containing protein [Prosthecobacter dejongeii]|uniref:DUF1549 domain-containing protein n=1 Tax=Prosthecobacter dejongeii TaxID=48465 RepID=A0A7W7YQ62_9BACT|nr:DUF1549 domain-containing protein [Prosthecobacter dejongeii]MBB5040328.1 hypothetical protein [Prosthecobacter dejongeii]